MAEADGTANPGGLPKRAVTRIDFPNHHLNTALTWYALALALTALFAITHRPAREEAT